jgi:Tfp pilus assembly protein PilF
MQEKLQIAYLGESLGTEKIRASLSGSDLIETIDLATQELDLLSTSVIVYFANSQTDTSYEDVIYDMILHQEIHKEKILFDLSPTMAPKRLFSLSRELRVTKVFSGPQKEKRLAGFFRNLLKELKTRGSFLVLRNSILEQQKSVGKLEAIHNAVENSSLKPREKAYLSYMCAYYLNDPVRTQLSLERFFSLDHQALWCVLRIAELMIKNRRPAEALELLHRLDGENPDQFKRYERIAEIYLELADAKNALTYFKKVLPLTRNHQRPAKLGLGKVCLLIGEDEKAMQFLASKELPKNVSSYLNRYGIWLVRQREFKKAAVIFAKGHALSAPNEAYTTSLLHNKLLAQSYSKNFKEAVQTLEVYHEAIRDNKIVPPPNYVALRAHLNDAAAGKPLTNAFMAELKAVAFKRF